MSDVSYSFHEDAHKRHLLDYLLTFLLYYKNVICIIAIPIILLPLPIVVPTEPALCGYFVLLMGFYWCLECLPLGVTSLLPVFLAPTFGFISTKEICPLYFSELNMMLLGGLVVALSIERCNLHKRVALNVLLLVGTSPRWLLLGFMLPTWFLSMWISNTATSAMMLPIVLEVIKQIESVKKPETIEMEEIEGCHSNPAADEIITSTECQLNQIENVKPAALVAEQKGCGYMPTDCDAPGEQGDSSGEDPAKTASPLAKALVISIAYAANSGGIGTLIGTTCNLICKNEADVLWRKNLGTDSPINFATWMAYGIPISLINLVLIWIWLGILFIGPRELFASSAKRDKVKDAAVTRVIQDEYKRLGPISQSEIQVSIIFLTLVVLWFFRKPDFVPGWNELFKEGFVGDAVPAIFIAVVVFSLPSKYALNIRKGEKPCNLMDWQMITEKFPWSVILLLGGGFALAECTKRSGLSDWLGNALVVLDVLPGPVIIIIITYIVTLLTQFTSNTASATLMMPIVASMSIKINRNPLYLMLPVTVGTQLAFMLPVATPPNAVAFSSGLITVMDLVKAGTLLNIVLTFVAAAATLSYGVVLFDLEEMPWDPANNTAYFGT